jgi:beta-lactamase class A
MHRRDVLAGLMTVMPALLTRQVEAADRNAGELDQIRALEQRHGGRLGVAILDTGNRRTVEHRGGERFPLCSTVKLHAAAYVLARVDQHKEQLDRRVVFPRDYLVAYSPKSEKFAGDVGMTMGDICSAALTLSDNTAGNLMLDSFGGPSALTRYLRSIGDFHTRLDRRETALNEGTPGDPRDTTTPLATLEVLRRTVLGDALTPASRTQLATWLMASTTGNERLRAGVPSGWRVGDKTGSGAYNITNDIAVIWPENRAPIVVAAYYTQAQASPKERNDVLAAVGRVAAEM